MSARPRGAGRNRFLPALLVVALTFLTYRGVGGFQFVQYDDPGFVTDNARVRAGLTPEGVGWAFTSITEGPNWFPLTWLSHQLSVQLFGLEPGGHHLVNVALHAAAAAALFFALRGMTGAGWCSALVAALFAVHPLNVEPVAWVTGRKDVLAALFWILTLGAWGHYARRPGPSRYLLALGAFALGLMSKPVVVTLPVVLLLLDLWPLGRQGARGVPLRRLLLEKVPFVLPALAVGVLTYVAQSRAGAVRLMEAHHFGLRAANAALSFLRYLAKAAWPADLAVFYPFPRAMPPLWQVAGAMLVLVALSLAAVRLRRSAPWLGCGWLWYLVTLLPVIGLVQVGDQAVADRYAYLPLVGVFVALAWSGSAALARRGTVGLRAPAVLLAVVVVLALAGAARHQLRFWRDTEALMGRVVEVSPEDRARALQANNLGVELAGRGRLEEAEAHYLEAIRLNPRNPRPRNNLGAALAARGRLEEAARRYREALALDPRYASAHFNLGDALVKLGRSGEAEEELRAALRLETEEPDAANTLGALLLRRGEATEAVAHLEAALRARPEFPEAHYNLGLALERRGETGRAAAHYREALRLRPGDLVSQRALQRLGGAAP